MNEVALCAAPPGGRGAPLRYGVTKTGAMCHHPDPSPLRSCSHTCVKTCQKTLRAAEFQAAGGHLGGFRDREGPRPPGSLHVVTKSVP